MFCRGKIKQIYGHAQPDPEPSGLFLLTDFSTYALQTTMFAPSDALLPLFTRSSPFIFHSSNHLSPEFITALARKAMNSLSLSARALINTAQMRPNTQRKRALLPKKQQKQRLSAQG
jgi:hypothetical protein